MKNDWKLDFTIRVYKLEPAQQNIENVAKYDQKKEDSLLKLR